MPYEYIEYGTAGRCMHKPDGATKTVYNDAEKAAALADGWSLEPINGHVIDFDEVAPEPVIEEAPARRGKKARVN